MPPLSSQQIQLMNHLQKNQETLRQQDKVLLQQLQNQYYLYNQQQQKQMMCKSSDSTTSSNQTSNSSSNNLNNSQPLAWSSDSEMIAQSNLTNNSKITSKDGNTNNIITPNLKNSDDIVMNDARSNNGAKIKTDTAFNNHSESLSPSHSISEADLRSLLSPKQSQYPITDVLIAEYGLNGETRKSDSDRIDSSQANTAIANSAPSREANNHLHLDSSIVRPFNKWEQILSSPQTSYNLSSFSHPIRLSIDMSASEAITACKGVGSTGRIDTNLLSDDCRPPSPIQAPYPPLPKDKLLPSTPSVFVS